MKKLKKHAAPMTALIVSASVLLLWAASMSCFTLKTANNYADYFDSLGRSQSSAVATVSRMQEAASDTWNDGLKQYWIAEAIRYANNNAAEARAASDGGIYFSSINDVEFQSAAAFYDGEGNLIANSGDYFYFNYDSEEVWNSADPSDASNTCGFAKVMINIADLDEQNLGLLKDSGEEGWQYFISGFNISAMRFTGALNGTTLVVSKIEYVLRDEFQQALFSREPDEQYTDSDGAETQTRSYSVGEVIRSEGVQWHTLFDNGAGRGDDEVTLYTTMPAFSDYTSRSSGPLPYLLVSGTRDNIYPDSERGI